MATATSGVKQVGTNYYTTSVTTNTDGSLKATTSRTDASGKNGVPVSTVNTTSTGQTTRTFESGATEAETEAFNNPDSEERKAYTQQVTDPKVKKDLGISTPEEEKLINSNAGKPNTATGTGADGTTPVEGNVEALNAEFKAVDKGGTRNSYGDFKYPLNLKLEVQDVIKFSILKYVPSLSTTGQSTISKTGRIVTLKDGIPIVGGSEKIGTITLPIPAGINDSNNVSWQQDTLNVLQKEGAEIAKALFERGTDAAVGQTNQAVENLTGPDTKQAISGLLIGQAVQANIGSRAYGSVNNNNLEVLFGGPGLRNFSFQFSFYPREPKEAIEVRKIIRTFKQSMSVKRSANSLLLKAPHTFAISYITSKDGKAVAHPYLNRFKECALTSCSVDYTPDGTYMTYDGDEKSMTAYRLSLSFSELEPIFDDEYGATDYDNIGF